MGCLLSASSRSLLLQVVLRFLSLKAGLVAYQWVFSPPVQVSRLFPVAESSSKSDQTLRRHGPLMNNNRAV